MSSKILIIEPFYGGSHKDLIITLIKYFDECNIKYTLVTLSAKKWHWRARCGALQIYQNIPQVTSEKILFCSSVLNLSELLGIRPDLQQLQKIVYFHENQLIYPVQEIKSRDIQYAYNQITTCVAANMILFNSAFNRRSFLDNINKIIKVLPDNRPKNLKEVIGSRSHVLYFPVTFPKEIKFDKTSTSILHIVWPHRWEFDKGPEDLFNILLKLKTNGHMFKVSILGQTFTEIPEIFEKAKERLSEEIIHFGYLENKSDYFDILCSSNIVLSTAKHEFFGVSVLEAVYCNCLPIVPNSLVYPEIYPKVCLYSDLDELYHILQEYCLNPAKTVVIRKQLNIDCNKYSSEMLLPKYRDVLGLLQ